MEIINSSPGGKNRENGKEIGFKHRIKNQLEVIHEYSPDLYSAQRLNEVYAMLFGEIQDLIIQETINNCNNKYVRSKTT